VTTHPAKMIGLDHRIGYLSPGYDADVVVWQSHPLAVGAAPAQVYIDGIPQLDPPVLRSRPESDQSAPPAGNWTKEIAYDIATKGDPDYSPRAVHLNMAFINVSSVILRRDGSVKDLSPSDATFDVVVDRGEIDCIGKCAFDAEIPIIDLKGGSLAPGLTSSGIPLGLKYEEGSGSFDPDADAMSSETKALTQFAVNKAADGVFFGTKKLWRAVQSGVTHSITHSVADKVLAGTSTFIRLHAEHSLYFGILVDTVALHVTVSKIAAESAEVAQLQLGTLRSLLLGHNGPSQRTPIGKAFEAVSREEIPLVVSVLKADEMARLISIKREVEAEKGTKIRMVFHDATEAHLLAKEIAEAEIGVIVAPARAFPYTAEESRFLPGVPLSNETVISTLWKAGVVSFRPIFRHCG
jgi:hypothetical protein